MSILNLIRSELLTSSNYVPGGEGIVNRLHANELPWAPVSKEVIAYNFYPSVNAELELAVQLAKRYQIEANQLVLTRGSDDGIDLVTRLFLRGGDALMQFPPTFPMYAFYVRLQQAQLIQCPLNLEKNFELTFDQINESWQEHCKIIMFCRPNNPTGNLVDLNLIAATCERYVDRAVIVVDEAYIEFAASATIKSASTLIAQYDNLIVLRTLSKAYGLAGLRIGAILAQSQVIAALQKIIAPYIISSAVIEIAKQALNRDDWFPEVIQRIQKERSALILELKKLPFIEKIYPSETNFILVKTSQATELAQWLTAQHIAVRDFPSGSLLHQHLRITVGNEEQNQLMIQALSSFIF